MRFYFKRKAKKQRSQKWSPAYRWLATGALAIYSAAGGGKPAFAQATAGVQPTPAANPKPPLVRFDTPSGPLEMVLGAFTNATGLHVDLSEEGLLSLNSPGVTGLYTPEDALRILLRDTGLTFRFTSAENVRLEIASASTTVDVTEAASALASSSVKYSEPVRDTPQSITAVSQQTMQQQGTTTLRDALRNVSGISLAAGEGGAQGDNLTIRGFSARSDLFIDGMRDFGSYYRDNFNTEEVEVLQGPSSVTFGRGSTGGVVNQATKQPRMDRFVSTEADFGTDETRRGVADINAPISKFGHGAAFRLNLMGVEAKVAGRDVTENRRWGVAPSLTFGLATTTRFTLSYFHQKSDDTPDYGIPWLFNGPAPVDRHNYYGFKDGNYLRTAADIGTARLEHDFNANFSLRNQLRLANYEREVRVTEPKFATTPSLTTPLSQLTVTRNEISVNSAETGLDNQLDLTGRFRTGWLEHSVVGGVEASRETSDPTRFTWTGVPTTSLLDPNENDLFSGTSAVSSQVQTTATGSAGYALDTIRLGQKWQLSGGLRWDRFAANYQSFVGTVSAFRRVDKFTSWRSALVYKPVAAATLYAAAGTSFNPSAESLSLSASTANLPPESNRNIEAGTKWDLRQGKLSTRAALFRTEKLNAREPDPNNSLLNVLAGKQRVNGVTVEMNGQLTSRWSMLAGYTHLDAKVVSSQYYPASIGAQLANVAADTFNFWSNYRFPRRWQLGAGGNYVGSRTASSTAPLDPATGLVKAVPGYWVFNAMAEHRLSEHVELQGNVYNIANRYYYDQLHPAHIIPGPGRSALIGLKFRF